MRMRVGLFQFCSTDNPWQNLAVVDAAVQEAIQSKVELLCFPENVFFRGPRNHCGPDYWLERDANDRMLVNSEFSKALDEFQKSWSINVSLGSVNERAPNSTKPYNSHWIFRPNGIVEAYQKIHLFDFVGANAAYKESDDIEAGSTILTTEIGEFQAGLSICYDLRFAELYRQMVLQQGANLLLVPAAFTYETGRAHWHSLLRARAIENLSFVMATGQWGYHQNEKGQDLRCFGHSLIISPWGEILAEGPEEGDALLVADLDMESMNQARAKLPALTSVRMGGGCDHGHDEEESCGESCDEHH